MQERNKARLERLKEIADSTPRIQSYAPLDFDQHSPERFDPSFWEADWNMWWNDGAFGGERQADGIHWRGKKTYNGASLINRNFGSAWRLELHSNRIPPSPTNRWRSDPHVNLFGGLLGYVGEGDIFTGDLWSKCWMIRRQTLFQVVPQRRVIVEKVDVQLLIFIEEGNIGPSVMRHVTLPGFQWMPSVQFGSNQIDPSRSIWAELEVRFDIQLEGNSLFWIDNDVLLQTFQWPLVPIS